MATLGDLIRTAREEHGWNRSQLGRRARVNPATIGRIEKGETRYYKAPTVWKLAKALSLTWARVLEAAPQLAYESETAPEVAGGESPTFQPGAAAPADSGGDAAGRERLAEADDLRALVREILTRTRALEDRVGRLEGTTEPPPGHSASCVRPIPSRRRAVARARVWLTSTRALGVIPVIRGADAPGGLTSWTQ